MSKSPFCRSGKRKKRTVSKQFSSERKTALANSDKGSYYAQEIQWPESFVEETSEFSETASSRKILKSCYEEIVEGQCETREDLSPNDSLEFLRANQLQIIDINFVEDGINEAAVCRKCGCAVEILEVASDRPLPLPLLPEPRELLRREFPSEARSISTSVPFLTLSTSYVYTGFTTRTRELKSVYCFWHAVTAVKEYRVKCHNCIWSDNSLHWRESETPICKQHATP